MLLLTQRTLNATMLFNYPAAFSAYLKDRDRDSIEYVRLILNHTLQRVKT